MLASIGGLFISSSKNKNMTNQSATVVKATPQIVSLDREAFMARIKESNMTTIDIRTEPEFRSGNIENSINLDFYSSNFVESLSTLEKDAPYSIYCQSGSRSAQTLSMMRDLGFTNVAELKGGYSSLNQ
jgi:thioredoxin 1